MAELPQIRAEFYLIGDEFNTDDVTKRLNITPSEIREKKDFPIQDFAHTLWVLDTGKESCKVVSWQCEKLIKLMAGKESVINQICKDYNVKTRVEVTINMENGDGPEIVLEKEIVAFLASINAEIGFDLYIA